MKYVSLDIETTGVDPTQDQILMLSAIVDDTNKPEIPVEQLPHCTFFIKHARYTGNAYALAMNGWIMDILSGRSEELYPVIDGSWDSEYNPYAWTAQLWGFLTEHFGDNKITVAGKNVAGFDLQFLTEPLRNRFRHRTIDPTIFYTDWSKDVYLPDLAECKRRAGINTPVAHDAREDAMDIIRLIRHMQRGVK